jgi:hypothetical protein
MPHKGHDDDDNFQAMEKKPSSGGGHSHGSHADELS